jgi:hypothetical protein
VPVQLVLLPAVFGRKGLGAFGTFDNFDFFSFSLDIVDIASMACERGFAGVKLRAEAAMEGDFACFCLTTSVVRAGTVNRACELGLDTRSY